MNNALNAGVRKPWICQIHALSSETRPYHRKAETVSGRIRNRTASPRHRLPLSREPKTGENCQENLFEILFAANPFFSLKSSRPPGPPCISRARARFLRTRMKNKAPLRPPARGTLDEHSFVAPKVLFSCSPAEQDLGLARTRQVQEPCSSPRR